MKRGWLQLLLVLTLFIVAVPSMALMLCQAFPSPHAGSAEVMTCVPSTVILALSGSARGSGITHPPEAKPDQHWEKKTLPTPSPPTHPATDRGKTEASPKIVGGKKGARLALPDSCSVKQEMGGKVCVYTFQDHPVIFL